MLSLLMVAAVVFSLSACASNPPNSSGFASVDNAVTELRLDQLGKVISDKKSGADRALTQQPTREVIVVTEGSPQTAEKRLKDSATSAHFEQTGASTYKKASGTGVLIVFYEIKNAGETVTGQTLAAGQSALTVSVTKQ